MALDDFDRALVAATQRGLPLVPRPYDAVGAALGVSGQQVQARMAQMLASGFIRRIGAVPNHYRLGFTANGMSVWDVDDAQVDALGERIGQLPGVSHCYRRPRRLPDWPYNLFAMLHGRTRAEVEQQAVQLQQLLGAACRSHAILYSTAILKKTGLRLTHPSKED
ncbi:protein nirH [Acidovorax sp. SRB_14]|uniref:siroheme decarboxylase subunit beta n=1 Tax=unclassified Acidovorax TaxID=2684926 RepID=UPI00145D0E63|nr:MULTISPECIES: AsnC family transcriptional regulator [unclassified Acidovorax]NMM77604.1 protein nirH [Acidovorax sp. SRB_24]NMM80230.1 protein nirH [Acidovorax sp. SRB_14]NMM86760.1 protein nirH [Rhodococcus sp. SRB_17]